MLNEGAIPHTTQPLSATLETSHVINGSHDTGEKLFPDIRDFKCKNSKRLIFSHLNVNSIRHKIDEVSEILLNGYTEILCLSETKIDDSFPDAQFDVNGFTLHRKDRNKFGGGLMCYVKSHLPHRRRNDIALNKDGIESIVIEVKFDKEKLMFIFVYKQPITKKHTLTSSLELMYNKCLSECQSVFIVGDLNVNLLKPENDLRQSLEVLGIKNIVKGPTC